MLLPISASARYSIVCWAANDEDGELVSEHRRALVRGRADFAGPARDHRDTGTRRLGPSAGGRLSPIAGVAGCGGHSRALRARVEPHAHERLGTGALGG